MSRAKEIHNILHFVAHSNIGGTERMLLRFIDMTQNKLFCYHVVTLSKTGNGPLLDELKERNVSYLNLQGVYIKKFGVIKCIWHIFRYIRKHQIVLVHTYGLTPSVIIRPIAKLCGVKIISGLRGDLGSWRSHKHIWIDKALSLFVDGWIANSIAANMAAIERDGASLEKIWVVYNGINLADLPVGKNNAQYKSNLKIVVIANLMPYKGHKYLINAFAGLEKTQLKHLKILFVGRDEMNGEIQHLISSAVLEPYITCSGYSNDPILIMNDADLLILPSETESFPVSILEAMALGKPVIATNVGGVSELVVHNETGILVPPKNSIELKKAITQFISPEGQIKWDFLKQLGDAGRKRVEQNFTIEKMVRGIESAYKKILNVNED